MSTAKAEAQTLLQELPDDCTFDDIHYHLYVVGKVKRGIESAEREGTVSQAAMEKRLAQWFATSSPSSTANAS